MGRCSNLPSSATSLGRSPSPPSSLVVAGSSLLSGGLPGLVEAAGFLPAVWLLNRLAGVYVDLARVVTGALVPPSDYRESHEAFLKAIERRNPRLAARTLGRYLERHDQRLLRSLKASLVSNR